MCLTLFLSFALPVITSGAGATCCFGKWGDETQCGSYPGGGGLCNNDWSTKCILDTDCHSPGPGPTPPSPTPPSPTPPSPAPGSSYPVDKLRFAGRWYKASDGGMVTSWGQSFFAKFTGTANVAVKLSGGGLYYSYRIDGGSWKKIMVSQGTVVLARNLAKQKEHTLHFGRSDEASYGTLTFYDLVLDSGYTALAPDAPKLTYQAIGDSITAGFKVDLQPGGGSPSTSNENEYETYVAHLADYWGTDDWSVVARSGVGVGPVSGAGGTMLEEYKCRDYSATSCSGWGAHQWDFSLERRQPDVITVNLGTNDYAFGDPSLATFQRNYKDFLTFVRSVYPHATIFCICPLQYSLNGPLDASSPAGPPPGSPPTHLWVPQARDKKWEVMRDGVEGAVKALGDPKIIYIATSTPNDPWMDGATEFSDWTHPTVEGHSHFAKLLEKVLTPIVRRNHPFALPAPSPSGELIGYYSWNWGKGSQGPAGATHGVAFTGLTDVQQAIKGYNQSWCCPPLHGTKLLSLGGGNSQGAFSSTALSRIASSLESVKAAGYAGVMFDIEEVTGGVSIVADFAATFAAVKKAGLQVHVTTSHSAPYQCDSPAIAVALVKSWVADPNIDVLSPQLYSNGKETEPEFAETNFCKAAGCTWELWKGAKPIIAPSLVFASQYSATQSWFQSQLGMQTGGFFEYAQEGMLNEVVLQERHVMV